MPWAVLMILTSVISPASCLQHHMIIGMLQCNSIDTVCPSSEGVNPELFPYCREFPYYFPRNFASKLSYKLRRNSTKSTDVRKWNLFRHPRTLKNTSGTTQKIVHTTMRLQRRFDRLPLLISPTFLIARLTYQVGKAPELKGPADRPQWSRYRCISYQCWLKVTKQSQYRDKWLSDETYFWAVKAQFPTLEVLGFQ